MLELLNISGAFLFSAAVCFIAILVTYCYVPETKGLNSEQLERLYSKEKEDNIEVSL